MAEQQTERDAGDREPLPADPLAILMAEREIYRTFYRFFRMTDLGRFADIGTACFTRDALIEYDVMPGPTQRFHGRDEFVAFMSAGGPRREPRVAHVVGQTTIDWISGVPHVEAYATVYHWAATRTPLGEHRPADWTVVGLVQDTFAQEDGRWLISRRHVEPVAGLVAVGTAPR
ncbi:nuclear transport factor 2 family protein [Spirillospora sp. CA-255316]